MPFIPDPVAWTEVPESLKILSRQRERWQRGLIAAMCQYKGMLFNPRYGKVGLLAMPFFTFGEMLAPVVELLGYLITSVGLAFGLVNVSFALLFVLVAWGYGMLLSIWAVVLEEVSFRRYRRFGDLFRMLLFASLENFGYRQMTVWWRLKAFRNVAKGVHVWGDMARKGFGKTSVAALLALCLATPCRSQTARVPRPLGRSRCRRAPRRALPPHVPRLADGRGGDLAAAGIHASQHVGRGRRRARRAARFSRRRLPSLELRRRCGGRRDAAHHDRDAAHVVDHSRFRVTQSIETHRRRCLRPPDASGHPPHDGVPARRSGTGELSGRRYDPVAENVVRSRRYSLQRQYSDDDPIRRERRSLAPNPVAERGVARRRARAVIRLPRDSDHPVTEALAIPRCSQGIRACVSSR